MLEHEAHVAHAHVYVYVGRFCAAEVDAAGVGCLQDRDDARRRRAWPGMATGNAEMFMRWVHSQGKAMRAMWLTRALDGVRLRPQKR